MQRGRVRIGLELTGKRIAREGAVVSIAGKSVGLLTPDGRRIAEMQIARADVGVVTSGTFAPTVNRAIAMAYVDPAVTVGQDVVIDVRGKGESAHVVPLPFYKRAK